MSAAQGQVEKKKKLVAKYVVYISPTGSDAAGDGSPRGPFFSPTRARDFIRIRSGEAALTSGEAGIEIAPREQQRLQRLILLRDQPRPALRTGRGGGTGPFDRERRQVLAELNHRAHWMGGGNMTANSEMCSLCTPHAAWSHRIPSSHAL